MLPISVQMKVCSKLEGLRYRTSKVIINSFLHVAKSPKHKLFTICVYDVSDEHNLYTKFYLLTKFQSFDMDPSL